MKIVFETNLREGLLLARKKQKINQEELAKKMGISAMYLSHLERGSRKLKLEVLEKWAKSLGFEVEIKLLSTKEKEGR